MSYTPDANYHGADSFTYTVSDGNGGYATATVNLTVVPVNDAPIAAPDNFETDEDAPLTFSIAALLGNDSDVDGDILSLFSFDSVTANGGYIVDNGDGTLTFTPYAGFDGIDSFTYFAGDGLALSNEATVTITVNALVAGTYTHTMDTPKAINDNGFTTSTITVVDSYTLLDINVVLDITHTRDQDLQLFLVNPDGLRVELFSSVGARGDGFIGTVLDDDAPTSIAAGSAPFTGVFRPVGDLSLFEGLDVQGSWTLEIYDIKKRETGTLNSWSIIVERGSSLLASSAPVSLSVASVSLTQTELDQAVDEAITRWIDSGLLNDAQLTQLDDLNFAIADLDGLTLGLTTAEMIYIDATAAGFGWFVDTTVTEDSEFTLDANGTLVATAGSEAEGRMDLLTVVSHEIGHILGIDHDNSSDLVLMDNTLDAGTRLLVSAEQDSSESDSLQDAGSLENWWKNDTSWYQFLNNHAAKKPFTGRSFRIS